MEWVYSKEKDTYLLGEENLGVGVFFDDGKWNVNVVTPNGIEMFTKDSIIDAKTLGESEYKRIKEYFNG